MMNRLFVQHAQRITARRTYQNGRCGVAVFMTLALPMSEETSTPVSHSGHWTSCNRC